MKTISIQFTDHSSRTYKASLPGHDIAVEYAPGFVVVTDDRGVRHGLRASTILEVTEEP